MKRHLTTVGLGMLSAITMLAANGQARGPRADGLVLQRINEVRRTDLVKDENGFSLDQPGLVLTWGIKVPEGRRVVALAADPRAIRATDSTGRDLSRLPKTQFGMPQHVQLKHVWGEDPHEVTLTLVLPARDAITLDLSATLDMTTDAGSRDVTLPVGGKWTKLDPELFGEPVQARLVAGREIMLEMRPGTIKPAIEDIQLVGAGDLVDSTSSMWNDLTVTYYFGGTLSPEHRALIKLRTDLQQTPVTIELNDQPLP